LAWVNVSKVVSVNVDGFVIPSPKSAIKSICVGVRDRCNTSKTPSPRCIAVWIFKANILAVFMQPATITGSMRSPSQIKAIHWSPGLRNFETEAVLQR